MNKNNYRNGVLALLFMLIALPAAMMAQTNTERYMVVTENDGTVTVFDFDEVESVTWDVPVPEPEPLPGSFGTGKANIGGHKVDVEWIQLWADGPRFAKYNVGVTDGKPESFGGYYCWGSIIDKDPSAAYKEGTDALTSTDDTATNLWGNNWRMPTKAELDDLLANCDVAWTTVNGVNGRKFTGKGDFASNSVFLPAAGDCDYGNVRSRGNYGSYWSSTPSGNDYAYSLDFGSSSQYVYDNCRDYGYSVRAIYDPQPEPEPTTGTAKATIGDDEVDVPWVQLWENGPKFAEYNVGVTDGEAESYGGYYAWGGNQDKVDDHNTGSEVLSGDNDTATKLWGNAWRMPTQAELQALIDNCDVEWTTVNDVNGRKFTGRGDYASNSVFLPATGIFYFTLSDVRTQGNNGRYWSSTPIDSDRAFLLNFNMIDQHMSAADRNLYGFSVRAVLR